MYLKGFEKGEDGVSSKTGVVGDADDQAERLSSAPPCFNLANLMTIGKLSEMPPKMDTLLSQKALIANTLITSIRAHCLT
jgi:hypothetical protein